MYRNVAHKFPDALADGVASCDHEAAYTLTRNDSAVIGWMLVIADSSLKGPPDLRKCRLDVVDLAGRFGDGAFRKSSGLWTFALFVLG
jgi:hypothetical protein